MTAATAHGAQFPTLATVTHLASCSLAPPSSAVRAALTEMLDEMARGPSAWDAFVAEAERARSAFASLIGADPGQIAVVPNASVGAYQAVSTINFGARRRIVTHRAEFPSIAHVWLAQEPRGAHVVFFPGGPPGIESYRSAIDGTTAMVSVPLVTYDTGARLPVERIAAEARVAGAQVFVDAYQAAGVVPVDVGSLGCDFLVAGCSKYLLGLPGVAFLYCREPTQGELQPTLTGWFGRCDPFALDPTVLDFHPTARRFETGTVSVPSVYAASAGMALIGAVGVPEVRRHTQDLVERAAARLRSLALPVVAAEDPDDQGAHIAIDTGSPAAAVAMAGSLASAGIAVSPRGRYVRVAFHYFTTDDDLDALADALRARPIRTGVLTCASMI